MDKYLVPVESSIDALRPAKRRPWKRSIVELNGRFEPNYQHYLAGLLMQSYSEVGAFPHLYNVDGEPCETHINRIAPAEGTFFYPLPIRKQGISGLDFDSKGYYLASVSKLGCLTIHDFETLYCKSNEKSPCFEEVEAKDVMHLSLLKQLDVVRWNIVNQDEVACASTKRNEVLVFDIGYVSSEPTEILRAKQSVTIHGSEAHKGFSDIAFTSTDGFRLFASDTDGGINVWDRRVGNFPCLGLTTNNSHDSLNSIQVNIENQTIFGAGKQGLIYMWDLRGGRTSAGFQSQREPCNSPLTSLRLSAMLEKIESLKEQSDIVSREIQSIGIDPVCPYQLAFHLDDGWSGVVDMYNFSVTHLHCPPPPWLNGSNLSSDIFHLRKASWLPTCSIYVVGSATENGIHFLDFFPDVNSPSHVDYKSEEHHGKQNKFVPVSEGVTVCAAHPLNGTIIAGTKYPRGMKVARKMTREGMESYSQAETTETFIKDKEFSKDVHQMLQKIAAMEA